MQLEKNTKQWQQEEPRRRALPAEWDCQEVHESEKRTWRLATKRWRPALRESNEMAMYRGTRRQDGMWRLLREPTNLTNTLTHLSFRLDRRKKQREFADI